MKNLKFISLVSFLIFIISGCSELEIQPDSQITVKNSNLKSTSITEYTPGTDITEQLKADLFTGLDVILPEGVFYLSESILVEGYSGTIQGAGKVLTIIKPNPDIAFKVVDDPDSPEYMRAIMLVFYNSSGNITVKDLAFVIEGEAPAEPHYIPYFGTVNTIDYIIVFKGIDSNVNTNVTATFENISIKGDNINTGGIYGKNLGNGIVIQGPENNAIINSIVKNNNIEKVGGYGLDIRSISGLVTLEQNEINDCSCGIYFYNVGTSAGCQKVNENSISNTSSMGIFIFYSSNIDITGNHFKNCLLWDGIFTYRCNNIQIKENRFEDCILWDGEITLQNTDNSLIESNSFINSNPELGAITLLSSRYNKVCKNDFRESNLPVESTFFEFSEGVAVFIMDYGSVHCEGNQIFEMKFPNTEGVTLCEMIIDYTDNPETYEYDGSNIIHNYQPCENLDRRDDHLSEIKVKIDQHQALIEE